MKNSCKRFTLLFLALLFLASYGCVAAEPTRKASDKKSVLLAILARNKAHFLSEYLRCIEQLDYDKKLITIYIDTNNNQDTTEEILKDWVSSHKNLYKKIIFNSHEEEALGVNRPHDWTPTRFKVLATIRNNSMQKAKEYNCDYYFVVDCDNFIAPSTLKTLISKKKPIIAPMLVAVPEINDSYSNYFCAVSDSGYYKDHPNYLPILRRTLYGTFKVPVVHCTYLIDSRYIDKLNYIDNTEDYEFVIFSRLARKNGVGQYICNEENFGFLFHFFKDITLEDEAKSAAEYFKSF